MENRITEEEFEEQFKPLTNHIVGSDIAAFSGCMFETFGPELDYVLSMARNPKTCNRVWTIIEGDEGLCYVAGYHIVNRLGYFITEKPYMNPSIWVQVDEDFE